MRAWFMGCVIAGLFGCGDDKAAGAPPTDQAPAAGVGDAGGGGGGADANGAPDAEGGVDGDGSADGGAADAGAADGGGAGADGGAGDGGLPPGEGCADFDLGSALGVVATGRIGGSGDDHPYCADRSWGDGGDLLFSWRAPADGVYSFSTADSSFDTLLTLYAGLCVEVLACNDDFDDLSSAVDAELREGDVVVLALDLYGEADGGSYTLTVAEGALPRADTGLPPDSGGPTTDSGAPPDSGGAAGGSGAPSPPPPGWLSSAWSWGRWALRTLRAAL